MFNILIIDDEKCILNLYKKIFKKYLNEKYKIIYEQKAENGLNILSNKNINIDIIILDINMKPMNGIEFLKKFNKLNLKIPIIIASAIGIKNIQEKNIIGQMIKPFEIKDLLQAIEIIIQKKIQK